MTREEAIIVFKAFMDNPLFSDVHKAAFSIAIHDIEQRHDWDINKLMLVPKTEWEQEPTTKNNLSSELEKNSKKLENSTTKNNLGVDCIDRQATLDAIIKRLGIKNETYLLEAERVIYQQILAMPSVTPQLSSELDKNSKKLEKDFGESDCISRQAVLELIADYDLSMGQVVKGIHALPSVTPQEPRWIPVSEKLPKDLEPVNITWINHDPEPYYNDIKDKPFTATGVYFNGQWYWWSTLCTDILAEYSHNYNDIIDDAIEVTAWMPLPQAYREAKK